jgi:hypothetical protein
MMVAADYVIPSPAERLAMFRADRLESGVSSIMPAAMSFRDETDRALAGTRTHEQSQKALTKAFVASYRAFSESLESARTSGVIDGSTIDVLHGIMTRMRDEYASGLASMREDVARLEEEGPSALKQFCTTASDKIDRLEQFWQTTYQHAPKMRM